MWARWGKLVHQLHRVITFSYDVHFRHTIARWKGQFEEYTLFHHTLNLLIV
jgi:hypothetical protein